MRKLIISLFILLLVIYAGGAICVPCGFFDWEAYYKLVAIVGGLASVIGLGAASFVRVDLLSYDAEAIKRLAEAAKEIENKNTQIKNASDKIASLEYKKEELEVLVKKASMILFYKEELSRLYEKLLTLIHKDEELSNVILEIPQKEGQLESLEGEMVDNPEIKEILNTIQKAKKRNKFEFVFDTIFGSVKFRL